MEVIPIKEAKLSDLLAFYNTHTVRLLDGKPRKSFKNREAAERDVYRLVESLASYFGDKSPTVPPEGMIFLGPLEDEDGEKLQIEDIASNSSHAAKLEPADGEDDEEDEGPQVNTFGNMAGAIIARNEKKANEPEDEPANTSGRSSNSAGVRKSWKNKEVHEARMTKNGVEVECDGVSLGEFRSTGNAFATIRLPMSKCIRFRVKLKKELIKQFEHDGKVYTFRMLESVPTAKDDDKEEGEK